MTLILSDDDAIAEEMKDFINEDIEEEGEGEESEEEGTEGKRKHDETLPLMRARNEWLTRDISDEELHCALRVLAKLEKAAETTTIPM